MIDTDRLDQIAHALWADVYETRFGGQHRGAFRITRRQMRDALGGESPDAISFMRLNALACEAGLMLVDLGDSYACIEIRALRALRRPSDRILANAIATRDEDLDEDEDEDEDEDDTNETDEDEDDENRVALLRQPIEDDERT